MSGIYKIPKVIGIGQKPPFGARVNWHHPLSQGLVGAWLFNEGSGGTAYNAINGNGTFYGGMKWHPNGVQCDANGQYVDFGDLFYSNKFSVATRIIPTTVDANLRTIVVKRNQPGTVTDSDDEFLLAVDTTSTYFYIWDNTGANYAYSASLSANIQYSLVGVCDIPAQARIYVNGNKGTDTTSGATLNNTTSSIQIGARSGNSDVRYGRNIMDYLYIYNRVLYQSEITALHANPYQMFWNPMRDIYIVPAAAPAVGVPTHMDYYRRMRER